MNYFNKIIGAFQFGGFSLLLYTAEDILLKTDKSTPYVYQLFETADKMDYHKLIKSFYEMKTGDKIDLDNPVTFNEKLQWLKLYDSTPLKTKLSDKYLVRSWIKETIGEEYLIPLLGVWNSFEEIDFDTLPDAFVLKCNHGSGWNQVVQDKSSMDTKEIKSKFDLWINTNYAYLGGELHYEGITPKIIAEQYIDAPNGLIDYRFFCFNGIPAQIWVDKYSGTPNHIRRTYDMDWNRIKMRCTWPEGEEAWCEQPSRFEEMKRLSKKLSHGFAFVRVDFYEVNGNLFFGEMTFTPMNGLGLFEPKEWDERLGNLLTLPSITNYGRE